MCAKGGLTSKDGNPENIQEETSGSVYSVFMNKFRADI